MYWIVCPGFAEVELAINALPAGKTEAQLTHYRIDETHSNAFTVWKTKMGSTSAPNEAQYAQLLAASELAKLPDAPATVLVENGAAKMKFILPRQAVSLLILEWK